MVEGLTVEELARLKAEAEGYQIGARPGSAQYKIGRDFLALITQVERLTAERDEARRYRDIDAFGQAAEKARADTLAAENGKLREALGFASSVIKSGESWTATCERVIKGALAAGEPARSQAIADARREMS